MSHYAIHLPGERHPSRESALEAHGLSGLLDPGADRPVITTGEGPTGEGTLVAWEPSFRYDADQTWHDCGGWWLGWDTQPTPEDLLRPQCQDSFPVTLEDGNEWLVPLVRRLPEIYGLPNGDGKMTRKPHPKYTDYCNFVYDTVIGQWFHQEHTDEELVAQFCGRALAINYRINWHIGLALGLFTKATCQTITVVASDAEPLLAEAQRREKKTGPVGATSDTSNGEPALEETPVPST